MKPDETAKLTPLQKAVAALERMKSRVARLEDARSAPIAIVGIGCRFPGGVRSPEDFWRVLSGGVDAVTPIPASRWDVGAYYDPDPDAGGKMYTRHGAFVDAVDAFDAEFFGISAREAEELDPRQRLLLETTWEALERAGIVPRSLEGSRTGVFVGIEESDYGVLSRATLDSLTAYTGLGRMTSTAAGRLSFVLGLQGPCVALDTACSSSLVALHFACQSLRTEECRIALAGGVSLHLSPLSFVALSRTRALAPDGRCKTFSARADGYGRGEGCGMIVLKRLADAEADGDPILAVIRGSAVAHDGTSSGLTVPNGSSQRQVLGDALGSARLGARDVQYVECHGTGTALGDPIEVHALGAVYGADRPRSEPLLIGTAKTNIGHLEAAAGIAGLLKVVLSLKHAAIPPSLHFDRPNPHIAWSELPVEVVTALRPWPAAAGAMRAGVSAFGMSGTNAHVIVEAPAPRVVAVSPAPARAPQLLFVSAKSEAALRLQAGQLAAWLSAAPAELADVAHALSTKRSAFRHRLALVATDAAAARQILASAAAGSDGPSAIRGVAASRPPSVAFMVTGQGAQYAQMSRGLYQTEPLFRSVIDRAEEQLADQLPSPLRSALFPDTDSPSRIDETAFTQPAMFAVCYALASLFRAWGIEPAYVLGHSIGEYVAACLAGVFSFEDALRLVAARGRLMQALPVAGAMMSIEASEAQVAQALAPHADAVSIAAINGPRQVVIAGQEAVVTTVGTAFAAAGVRTRRLRVSHAFHSPLMRPMLDAFRAVAESVSYARPRIPFVSTVTGTLEGERLSQATYWIDHVLRPVRMHDGLRAVLAAGATQLLEIGPSPVLCGMAAASAPGAAAFIPSLRRDRDDTASVLESLARLWTAGVPVDWTALAGPGPHRPVPLPTYAFDRQRHWLRAEPYPLSGVATSGTHAGPGGTVHELSVGPEHQPYLRDHVVHQRGVVPGAFYLSVILAVAADRLGAGQVTLRDVEFVRPLITDDSVRMQVRLAADHRFTVASDVTHISGTLEIGAAAPAPSPDLDLDRVKRACPEPVSVDAAYDVLQSLAISWGPAWRWITEAHRGEAGALVRLAPPPGVLSHQAPLHPCVIDNGFGAGVLASIGDAAAPGTAEPSLPYAVGALRLHRAVDGPVWCLSRRRPGAGSTELVRFDLVFWDDTGALVAEVEGFTVKRAPMRAFFASAGTPDLPLFGLSWRPAPVAGSARRIGRVGVFSASETDPLAAALTQAGTDVVAAPRDSADVAAWLERTPLDALVCVWGASDADASPAAVATARAAAGLRIVQAVLRARNKPRRLLWVTQSASAIDAIDAGEAVDPSSATLWGLGRVAAQEHPEIALRLVSLHDPPDLGPRLLEELAADDDETQIALGRRGRLALRLHRMPRDARALALPDAPSCRLVCDGAGGLDGLALAPASRRPPEPGEVEVEVEASGLNFRDVVNVLRLVPELGPLGGEIAGRVTAVGAGAAHFAVGDAVMGLAPSGFSRYVTADARWLVARPAALSPEQAAAWPVVFLSAWIALRRVAAIRPGERVLIHAAAGGVGMAAIQLAQRFGAEVYATASPAKWDAIRNHEVAYVGSSRTLDFAADIRRAGGVDVVMNTLAGEFIDASLSVLRPGGRFVELGKTDLRDPAAVHGAFPGVRYEAFDLAKLALDDPDAIQAMLVELRTLLAASALKPLPVRTWPLSKAPLAFEHMARAAHVGKIVLVPDGTAPRFRPGGSALITGGLGALGLEVARWLVRSQGVRHLILVGRRSPSAEAQALLAELRDAGATIEIARCDVADFDALRALVSQLPPAAPLRVIVHAAGVLDDGVLTEQTGERFAAVLAPKVSGAWNLHRLAETASLDLDAFVLFSSISGWLGNAGQGNYAAANAFLDALAAHRRARGLVATSIAWGAWSSGTHAGGLGMTARLTAADRARIRQSGLGDISPSVGVALLAAALDRGAASIGAFSLHPERISGAFGAQIPPLLRAIISPAPSTAPARAGLEDELRALPPAERQQHVQSLIAGEVSRVMRTAAVPLDQPLQERGLDSLMAVEVRNGIAAKIGKALPVTLLFDHPTIAALSRHILDEVLAPAAHDATGPVPDQKQSPAPASWSEPIAIVGIGCRFPGDVVDPESFWTLLAEGTDAIGEVPPERWDIDAYFDPDPDAPGKMYTRWGGFLPNIDRFDAGFFGISGREARSVDPQERLMLEASWEALERARLTAEALKDSATGVYMGVCSHEYSVLAMSDAAAIDAYSGLGTAHSAMVGRISYCLGLRGPNLAIDTACSSSLVAVHLACQALRAGECSLALAGGVNTILFPEGTIYFSRLRAMSPTGRCRSFSAGADGYVRSEGVGVVVLERLSDARARGREILAVIRGTAVNQDGRSQGLTAPSGPAQQAVIRRALDNAGIAPREVDYVECHGTGTPLGDPIELHALAGAYGVDRPPGDRLAIGSVKSNLGHTEGAAGIAGLIKAVLAIGRGALPRSLHTAELSPHVPWDLLPLDVVRSARPWPQRDRPRRAGVSAFGFSGTNAHVVLEQAPEAEPPPVRTDAPAILTVSAKSAAALRGQAGRLGAFLARASEDRLTDVAHALRTDRSVFWHRLAIDADDRVAAAARLATFAREGSAPGVWTGEARDGTPEVAFLFTGQGAQYAGMGRGLYAHEPVFRAAIDRCAALLDRELPRPLLSVLHDEGAPIDETAFAQPALFAVGYALAALWQHWGVTPAVVLGHSIGEYAAACVAGVFSLEDAVRLVAARGRLMQALPARGAMMMIGTSEARVLPALAQSRDRVSIAAVNGPAQVVISGDEPAVLAIGEQLAAAGVRTRRLRVSHAFHSPLMAPMLDAFDAVARTVSYAAPTTRIVGTAGGDVATAAYWVNHVRAEVRFFDGLRTLLDAGVTRFLEIGPAPVLSSLGAESFPDAPVSWLPSLRADRPDVRTLRESAARLWVSGVRIAWHDTEETRGRRVTLPSYAFERERHWLDARPALAPRQTGAPPPTAPPPAPSAAIDTAQLDAADLAAWVRREVAATLGAADPGTVSPSRELFEQGFDSLLLVELRRRLSAGLGRPLPMPLLFQHRTIEALTAHLVADRASTERTPPGAELIVPLARSPLLFLFPGALGGATDFFYLSQRLMPEWSVLGIDYPGTSGGAFHTDIRPLAAELADKIAQFSGDAPIVLGGHSFGGGVAWEVCHELLSRGRAVELVLMLDTFCPLGLDGYAALEQAVYLDRLERLPGARALFTANAAIAKGWRESSHLPADVRIVQFKVPEKDADAMKTARVDDPRDLWADYAAPGTYTVEDVPGTHGSFIVQSPEVDEVARRIKTHLAAVRERVAARLTMNRYGSYRK